MRTVNSFHAHGEVVTRTAWEGLSKDDFSMEAGSPWWDAVQLAETPRPGLGLCLFVWSSETWNLSNIKKKPFMPTENTLQFYYKFEVDKGEVNFSGLFISVINQLDAQNFCFTISLFHASTCFEHITSWWWAHMLETCRGMKWAYCKTKILYIKLVNYWDIYILRCTVNKTSKSFTCVVFK